MDALKESIGLSPDIKNAKLTSASKMSNALSEAIQSQLTSLNGDFFDQRYTAKNSFPYLRHMIELKMEIQTQILQDLEANKAI